MISNNFIFRCKHLLVSCGERKVGGSFIMVFFFSIYVFLGVNEEWAGIGVKDDDIEVG